MSALATPSQARDLSGHLGLGGQLDSVHGAAFSVKYWVSELGLQALFGLDTVKSTETEVGFLEYRPAIRVLYAMTRSRRTNLYGLVGLSAQLRRSSVDSGNLAFFDAGIGAEYFISDELGLAAHTTLSVELGASPDRIVSTAAFGASFHFYF